MGGTGTPAARAISSTTLSSRFCRESVVVPGTSSPPIIRATAWPPEESWATLNALVPPTTRPTPSAASRSSSGCHQGDQNQDRQDEIDHQLEGLASGRILLLKEIGGHGQSGFGIMEPGAWTHRAVAVLGYWNDTLGAARSVSAVSSSAACLKPNMPATLTAGKTWRRML